MRSQLSPKQLVGRHDACPQRRIEGEPRRPASQNSSPRLFLATYVILAKKLQPSLHHAGHCDNTAERAIYHRTTVSGKERVEDVVEGWHPALPVPALRVPFPHVSHALCNISVPLVPSLCPRTRTMEAIQTLQHLRKTERQRPHGRHLTLCTF